MCDQTEVSYLEDDVVWVKMGPVWWPGVVKDLEKDEDGQEILAGFKKKPIAVVKFFQEENYEFVKNLEHIYHYSCRRKDEFIKKGLDKYRTGASHMKKFPADVTKAESLTNGDINIINDPKFFPEKKESYSEIFGSGKKKSRKDSESTPKSKDRASSNATPYRPITHQRFINKVLHGESDHKVKTLIQCNSSSEDGAPKNPYKCHICKFETSRVNVIVAHHRLAHSSKNAVNWTGDGTKLIRKKPVYKSRKSKKQKSLDTSKDDDLSEEEVTEKKKSPKNKSSKEKPKTPEKVKNEKSLISPKRKTKEEPLNTSDSKKPRFTDELLADWNVDEEEDKEEKEEIKESVKEKEVKESVKEDVKEESKSKVETEVETKNECPVTTVEPCENSDTPKKIQSEKMSCFDFDDEEEGFIGMSNANTYGRKIPRVIPVKDKTELGMDLEIEELFKKKTEEEPQTTQENKVIKKNEENKIPEEIESNETKEIDKLIQEKEKPTPGPGRRRRSRASKEEDSKPSTEESVALRRTRRPGAKKSYLNEVIEKIEDQESKSTLNDQVKTVVEENVPPPKIAREEGGSSSRRKQDFRNNTLDSDREEMVYSEIVNGEQKTKTLEISEKRRTKSKGTKGVSDDLTAQIDSLLEETKLPALPTITKSGDKTDDYGKSSGLKSPNTTSFSFDDMPNEPVGKKVSKSRSEVKSISRMFSDSIPSSEGNSDVGDDSQSAVEGEETKDFTEEKLGSPGSQTKTLQLGNFKFAQTNTLSSQKRGSIVLSSMPKSSEGQVKVLPVTRQSNASKDCIVFPAAKKGNTEDVEQNITDTEASRPKNIKAIKVSSDSLPSSLITSGKLKGQTIIHQKGGKYVIVTQPPQGGRQRTASGKVQSGSKVVILTNQLGEQKIITASGLQTKFKLDGQKVVAAESDSGSASTSSGTTGQSQPVIKMVPDGKGGIMKQLTVSPKKVLLGGTKVLVSGSGSTLSSGGGVQKIALSSGGGVARAAGGDYRLIENYKGSGKTVLIQGSSSPSSGVVLKTSSSLPRQITKVIQSHQATPNLKKKPKILMRASSGQGEYIMQSATGNVDSPTFVVKQKGADGKFSAQKILRTEVINQSKVSPSGTKAFYLSGQGAGKRGESYIITTNESVPGKVIRMRQKIKEVDASATKSPQKTVHKASEVYSVSQNSLLLPNQPTVESETSQMVQIQEQSQQPVLQTQVIAMPGPVGADGNQTYVLVSVDENGVVQGMDNSVVAYDATAQPEQIFVNPTSSNNVILINPQANEEVAPVFSTSSQDILAEALANTNVLDGSISNEMESVVPSILLPPAIPSSVVQETSITLQKPIMTPLEMPSSVTPDTSGLEPPPLPPTPTEEDVLMEETEMGGENAAQEQIIENDKKEEESPADVTQKFLEPENFESSESVFPVAEFSKESENEKILEEQYDGKEKMEVADETASQPVEFFQSGEINEETTARSGELPREEFIIENSQEEQTTNSFQSLPILNDEPDTSDDAQGSDPIADQHFDPEKSRAAEEQFSSLLRDQEPPSSTNNEILLENNQNSPKYNEYESYKIDSQELKTKDVEEETPVEENQTTDEVQKDKEAENRESQSLPIIADECNANAAEGNNLDVISQKRFQEETEVSSTTDEFANKNSTD